jgi:H2-forming N5,N10-methylenetetrahydromethanopterin dehydrogenase-like enzyme
MLRLLEAKMLEIGDTPAHPFGLPATDIQAKYAQAGGAAAAGKEHEHNL